MPTHYPPKKEDAQDGNLAHFLESEKLFRHKNIEPPVKTSIFLRNCQLHAWAQSTITREVWELKGLTPRD